MASLDNPTILVVDDEPNVREMLEIGLSQHGFIVCCAVDGAQALTMLPQCRPDAILLDIMLPKIDGVSLVPLFRRITEAPILMLSALSDAQDKIAGLTAGADDYVGKPFESR